MFPSSFLNYLFVCVWGYLCTVRVKSMCGWSVNLFLLKSLCWWMDNSITWNLIISISQKMSSWLVINIYVWYLPQNQHPYITIDEVPKKTCMTWITKILEWNAPWKIPFDVHSITLSRFFSVITCFIEGLIFLLWLYQA